MPDTERQQIEIESLRASVELLEQQLAQLTEQVRSAQGRVKLSMRSQLRCPDCGCNKLLHSKQVLDRADGGQRNTLALAQPSVWRSKGVGQFEVYVCRECGLSEWYVKGVKDLAADHLELFTLLEGVDRGDAGPYR